MKRAGIPERMRLKGRQVPGLVVAVTAGCALVAALLLPDPRPQPLQRRIDVEPATEVLVLEQPAAGLPGSGPAPLLTIAPRREWLLEVTLARARLTHGTLAAFRQVAGEFEPPPGWTEIRNRPAEVIRRFCPSELTISPHSAPARLRVWQTEEAAGARPPAIGLRVEGASLETRLLERPADAYSSSEGCWRHVSLAGLHRSLEYHPPRGQTAVVADGSEILLAFKLVAADPAEAAASPEPFGLSAQEPLTARAVHVEKREDATRVLTLDAAEEGLRVERLVVGVAGLQATVSGPFRTPAAAVALSRWLGGPDWLVAAGLAGLTVLGLLGMAVPAKARRRRRSASGGDAPQAFISYTQADREWAEWVAWALEESGWTPILLDPDESAGSVFPLEMHEALLEAEKTAAILSESYCVSRFGALEWAATVADDPTGEKRKLVLLRVEPFTPPGLFKAFSYLDLVGADEGSAREKIAEAFPPPASFRPGTAIRPRPPYPGS